MRGAWIGLLAAALLGALGEARAAPHAASLEGVWTNATATPLQRPAAFDGLTTTAEKAAAYEKSSLEGFLGEKDEVGSRQSEWYELGRMMRVRGEIRTSIVVEPADGQLPYSEAGRQLLKGRQDAVDQRFEGPEVRPAPERCLTGVRGASGVPMFPPAYNGNYLIVQTPRDVVIWTEMAAAPRVIRLAAQGHLPRSIRPWMGDSIGRWEGPTLVVETTNLNPGESFKMPLPIYISEDARIVERFTRLADGGLLYAFSVDDPKVFTQVWRGEQVFRPVKAPLYEYACHEGNYSLPGVLAGARRQEAQ